MQAKSSERKFLQRAILLFQWTDIEKFEILYVQVRTYYLCFLYLANTIFAKYMYEKSVNQVMFACKKVSETSLYKTPWAQGHITVVLKARASWFLKGIRKCWINVNLDGGLSQRQ